MQLTIKLFLQNQNINLKTKVMRIHDEHDSEPEKEGINIISIIAILFAIGALIFSFYM